jgi:hypothetical protein
MCAHFPSVHLLGKADALDVMHHIIAASNIKLSTGNPTRPNAKNAKVPIAKRRKVTNRCPKAQPYQSYDHADACFVERNLNSRVKLRPLIT